MDVTQEPRAAGSALARAANILAIAVSPIILYLAVTRLSVQPAAILVAGWIVLRTVPSIIATASREQLIAALKLPLVAIFFSLLGGITNDARFLLLLPSATQLGFAGVFASSLRAGRVPLVETFARMQKKNLSDAELRYCRTVTVIWAVYLTACAVSGLLLAWLASPATWAVFTGAGSYVLVAALFGVEYVFRSIRFRSAEGDVVARTLFRWFPPSARP
jgi:uncharacterized membrane protein